MKYFLDTEFIEGFHKPLFGKRRHFIDLISIGIVCEDGREYYAISNEYNPNLASGWVKQNVINPMYIDTVHGDARNGFSDMNFHKYYGKPNKMIAREVSEFFGCWQDQHFWRAPEGIEVYGYFSDYDWVLFCSLFGRMIDLPKGFPMVCYDLKQLLDERAEDAVKNCCTNEWEDDPIFKGEIVNKGTPAFKTKEEAIKRIKENKNYPKQTNEHNALADAKWNYDLFKFLNQ